MPFPGVRVLPTGENPLAEALGHFDQSVHRAVADRDQQQTSRLSRLMQEAGLARLGVVPDDQVTPEPQAGATAAPGYSSSPGRMAPSAPPPVSSSIAGSPAYQDQEHDLASTFSGMSTAGRPAPVATPVPGAWSPGQGFFGVPTSRYSQPTKLEGGMSYDPNRSPEALGAQRTLDQYGAEAGMRASIADQERERDNHRAFNSLRAIAPTHPLVQNYDPSVDYAGEIPAVRQRATTHQANAEKQQGDYQALKAEFPENTLAKQPFDEQHPADYSAALANARQERAIEHQRPKFGEFLDTQGGKHYVDERVAAEQGWLPVAKGGAGGAATAAAQKEKTQIDMMEQSIGTMERLSPQVRGWAITAAAKHPDVANVALTQAEQSYLIAARDFVAGTNHLESGARLGKEQWDIGRQRFMPMFAESDQTKAEKVANARKTLEDRKTNYQSAFGAAYQGAAPASGAKQPPPASQDEYDHLTSPPPNGAGMTDAQVVARYGEPAASIRRKHP